MVSKLVSELVGKPQEEVGITKAIPARGSRRVSRD
jgi:hypothetical protein